MGNDKTQLVSTVVSFCDELASIGVSVDSDSILKLIDIRVADSKVEWDDDKPIPEDEAIRLAHPMKTRDFDTYTEALRMVNAKYSKYAIVDLVNWLLVELKNEKVKSAQV